MTIGRVRLLTQVRDLQIIDRDEQDCGIVDDVELEGRPGEGLRVTAILVGPGAYRTRLPRWAMRLVALIAGDHMARVPWGEVAYISSTVQLARPAQDYGLGEAEQRARRLLPQIGGLNAPE
ncbi:hypothetical protein SCH01S_02_00080 [Sphingomonas changbaiensis NBRC 104936]|uniref:PRC-barrel domain-containing protein n=1 Tax=Sphingomonas changbaiensis NBRC 104936 TaxID=1219043 RepID=A0A0E9MKS0_9SPHN|nr:hypothetical protein [Sphingomonas changbaiensis]GAO38011.1 hypothetical protein SCH01S_02_00080 [Sphingomonas changbaiensis NBRC 104936]